jgi:hypothetical protein
MTVEPSMLFRLNDTTSNGLAFETDPNRNPGWYQFVSDHKNYIRENSSYMTISRDVFNEVRHNLKRFLRQNNYTLKYTWVIEFINDHFTDMTFVADNVNYIYIPTNEFMSTLFVTYKSTQRVIDR